MKPFSKRVPACLMIAQFFFLQQAVAGETPNVLLIFPDQLNKKVIGCYGGPVDTPNIDRLAREGARFTEATCPTPYCSPSRMSLVTSRYPHQHGIVQNCGWRQRGMTLEERTYPRVLNEAGYSTHHYGKWHLEPVKKGDTVPWYPDQFRQFPEYSDLVSDEFKKYTERGPGRYSDWYGLIFPIEVSKDLDKAIRHNGLYEKWSKDAFAKMAIGMGRLDFGVEDYYDYQVADHAIETIKRCSSSKKPFMINVGFNVPHDPFVVPAPYYDMYPPDKIKLPDNADYLLDRFKKQWARQVVTNMRGPSGEEAGLLEFLRIYYGNVKFLDDQVGRILETLEETGEKENTIIVFLSDHGDMAGGHGMAWKETSAFYEEVVSIPLIVNYPKMISSQVNETPANTIDVFPTVFNMLGRDLLPKSEGKSLLPYMAGVKQSTDAYPYTFSERISGNPDSQRNVIPGMVGHFMIRGNGFKYMAFSQAPVYLYKEEPGEVLFHLDNDSGETENLANNPEFSVMKEKMRGELEAWLERTGWSGEPIMSTVSE